MMLKVVVFSIFISTIVRINAKKHNWKGSGIEAISGSCSANEIHSKCGSDCGKTCDDIGRKVKCIKKNCLRGCYCETGYYRDFKQNGRCVRSYECKSKSINTFSAFLFPEKLCSINEEYKCGTNCGKKCEDLGKNIHCPDFCETGCYCKKNYYRDFRWGGQCVREKVCVKKVSGKLSKNKTFAKWIIRQFSGRTS